MSPTSSLHAKYICTPEICQGEGSKCSTSSSICTCPDGWRWQFTLVKADCTSPKFMLEVSCVLLIVTSLGVLYRIFSVLPRARGTTRNAVYTLMAAHVSALCAWTACFIEDGFFAISTAFIIPYFCFTYLTVQASLQIVFIPVLGMKPSEQAWANEKLKQAVIVICFISVVLHLVAVYYLANGDIKIANDVLIGLQCVTITVAESACIFSIFGMSRLIATLSGHGSSRVGESNPVMNHTTTEEENNQLTSSSDSQQQNNSRKSAIERLTKFKQTVTVTAITTFLPSGFVFTYFAIGRAPYIDFYLIFFVLVVGISQAQGVYQLVPPPRPHDSHHGTNNNNHHVTTTETSPAAVVNMVTVRSTVTDQ
jgi:hypothetical protein